MKKMSALQIRRAARAVDEQSIGKQMNSFKRWGVTADWQHPYRTMDNSYVARHLRLFAQLFNRKLVYRAFKPVYWLAKVLFVFEFLIFVRHFG